MSIKVKISGDSSGFIKSVKGAAAAAKSSFASLRSFAGSLGGALGFFGFGSVSFAIGNLVDQLATLSKQARSLGLTAKEYQALKYAADSANVSFEAISSTLPKVLRRVAELRAGNTEAKKTFDMLGLSAENFAGKTSGEIFATVIAGLNGISDHGQKTAASMRLFEEQGGKLLDFFADYESNVKKFEKMGGGASSALARDAEKASQMLTDLETVALATLFRSVEALKRGDLADYVTGGLKSQVVNSLWGLPDHRAEEEAVELMEQRLAAKKAAKAAAEAEAAAQTAAAQAEIERLRESVALKKKQIELGEKGFAIYKAEADAAKKAGRALTDAEKEQIRQSAGELYDLTHPAKAGAAAAAVRQPVRISGVTFSDQIRAIGGSTAGSNYQLRAQDLARQQLAETKAINAKIPQTLQTGTRA